MLFATLSFTARQWLVPVLLLWTAAALILIFGYFRAPARGGLRAVAALLKMAGFVLLGLCLLEPVWVGTRAKPGANTFIVLADNSQGLQIRDQGQKQTRGELLRALLEAKESSWQSTLENQFRVHHYLFDNRLEPTESFAELNFSGRSTALNLALQTLKERYQGQPLAGILLLSDGNATDLPAAGLNTPGLPPVYPVVLGRDDPIKDISLQNLSVSQTAFEDAPVAVVAQALVTGYPSADITAELIDPDGQVVSAQNQKSSAPVDSLTFRFQFRPPQPGVSFYSVRMAPRDEIRQFGRTDASTEATLANNSRYMAIDRGKGPHRLLYVAGRPNWEYKFLQRALSEDTQLDLVGLIRVAKREPKFEFKGRQGETSNPLFRGFDRTTEETERYDKPVLVRLNPKDEFELRGGFPKTPEELYAFEALIIDDLEADFFTRDQMAMIQKFVSERGGGVFMLGGAESFVEGKYLRTPIGDLLPVYLERAARPQGELRFALTREGWLQPWARLRDNENAEKKRIEEMRGFEVFNRVSGVKPGATVVATVTDSRGNNYPGLVVQRYGNGRSAALTIGDLWHWALGDETLQKDLGKAWRQSIRWLIADVPTPVQISTQKKSGDPNDAVLIQVRARDQKFEPLDNAGVVLRITQAGHPPAEATKTGSSNAPPALNPAVQLPAEAAATDAGLYEATFIPRDSGGYQVEAFVTNSAGMEAGRAATGWTTDIAAEEFRSLKPNHALMKTLAEKTGGEVVDSARLSQFVATLPHRQAPIREAWTVPVWHQPTVFLLALACFVAEWGLRRWKGLA